jgi:UPF0755 protein
MKKDRTFNSKFSLFLILGLFVLLGLLKLDYDKALSKPNSDTNEKTTFEITEGESVDNILQSLIDTGLMEKRHIYYTKFYLRINNLSTKLQAGVYELPKNLPLREVIDVLQTGRSQDIWISIPEGLRKDEIARIIEDELSAYDSPTFSISEFLSLATNKDFIETLNLNVDINDLEGFLFPDSYAFPKDIDAQGVITVLVENFKTKVENSKYTYEDVILASIVEREGYNGNDRPIIAGIILKRYNEGWLLQTDATLLYPVKDWKHVITQQDKDDDNPYNTYKKIGLPPTPICNPGLQSLQAIWNPENTNYYYYIHDKDGNPHYGTTLEQHNNNVNTYLR